MIDMKGADRMGQKNVSDMTALQCRDVSRILSEMDRAYHRLAQRAGLSDCAFWIMYAMREQSAPLTQKELVEGWSYAKQTINSALKMLGERRLIRLEPATDDRRSKFIVLTDDGAAFAAEHIEPTMRLERRALEGLGAAEREQLVGLLGRYVSRLTEETGPVAARAAAPQTIKGPSAP